MATTFILPELGENIESGTVTAVLVKVGDSIDKDQAVIELETDKAVVEVPSPESGTISELMVSEGETLRVGETILVIDGNGAVPPPVPVKEEAPQEPEPAPAVEAPESEAALEPEPPAPVEEVAPPAPPRAVETPEAAPPRSRGTVRAAPSVRRFAREIGVDIHAVVPHSPGAPITVEDVKKHVRGAQAAPMSSAPSAPMGASTLPLPNFERWGHVSREKMSTIRRVTAESMSRSWSTIPHVTQNDKADITELEKFRKQYSKVAEAAGGKLTVTAILVKVLAEALKKFPQFNSSVDMAKHEIVFKQFYNIGVAVDTDHGLLVPSIKNADQKSLVAIAAELAALSEKARTRKASIDELQGSCMTITNLGGIGGTSFSPIVNAPEVAILGVSRGAVEPVYIDGEFVPRMTMPVSLSYDHRVIDGADAARFARWVCQALEQPLLIHLDH